MFEKLRRAFLQNLAIGLLTLIPIFGTFIVVVWLLNFSDNFLFNMLPERWRPHTLLGFHPPGLGILLTVIIIWAAGVLTRNFFGRQLYSLLEGIIQRIPLMNTMYSAIRQITQSIFMDRSNAFRKVVMVEFPHSGAFSLAFVTAAAKNSTTNPDAYKEIVSVFVPTTPNPTSGFYMLFPDWAVRDVDMTVQEAFRIIVSGGVLAAQGDGLRRMEKAILPSVEKLKARREQNLD